MTQDRIKTLRRDLEQIAALRSKSNAPGDHEAAQVIKRQADGLKEVEKGATAAHGSVKTLSRALDGLSSLAGLARAGAGGFIGGAIDGPVGGLLGAIASGSITGMVAAVGTIVGMATKMAYTFEQTATRAALQLSVGTGGGLAGNVKALKDAANSGLKYNISAPEMLGAMARYGETSGSTVKQTVAAASTIGLYSKAYGMTADEFADKMGPIVEMSGDTLKEEAQGIFGAMERGGALGRSPSEFISLIPGIVNAMQSGNPGVSVTGTDAANFISSISQAGGSWANPQQIQTLLAGYQSLGAPAANNLYRMGLFNEAGITDPLKVLGGTTDMKDLKALAGVSIKRWGLGTDAASEVGLMASLTSGGQMSQAQAETFIRYMHSMGAGSASDPTGMKTFNKFGIPDRIGTLKPGQTEEQLATERYQAYVKSMMGQDEKVAADLENKELALGEVVLTQISKSAKAIDELFSGNFKGGIVDLITSNGALVTALMLAAAASTLGPLAAPLLLAAGPEIGAALAAAGIGIPLAALIAHYLAGQSSDKDTADDGGKSTDSSGETDDMIAKVEHNESSGGTNFPTNQLTSGAMGNYGFEGPTEAEVWENFPNGPGRGGLIAMGYIYKGADGKDDLTARGRAAFIHSPQVQRRSAGSYLATLRAQVLRDRALARTDPAMAHLLMGKTDDDLVLGAYTAGGAHMGDYDYILPNSVSPKYPHGETMGDYIRNADEWSAQHRAHRHQAKAKAKANAAQDAGYGQSSYIPNIQVIGDVGVPVIARVTVSLSSQKRPSAGGVITGNRLG